MAMPDDLHLANDPVFTPDGQVKPDGFRQMAAQLATADGVAYRFGPSAQELGASTADRPTAYQPADKPLDMHGNGPNKDYQIGGPQDRSRNDFSGNQGQVGYVPNPSEPQMGIDHIQTLGMQENTFTEKPGLTWQYYGGGHPEVDFLPGKGKGADCVKNLGSTFGRFVAQARAYAHGEATANSFVVFDNGVIATAGTNTARGAACAQLPQHLHPSAISLTNGNEFALVTAWNMNTLRSELVVFAVGGQQPSGTFWNYEWSELYPGMSNYGRPTFLKMLGSVRLPMVAATGLSAVSDVSAPRLQPWKPTGGTTLRGVFPLSVEENRQTFIGGRNAPSVPRAGYAIVTSRSERKVVFVDLQPLFQRITGAYFGTRAQFDATRNIGQGATQWPPTFSAEWSARPVVAATLTMDAAPSAAAGLLSGAATPRAYVATEDGTLHVIDVGGLASGSSVSAADVREVGMIAVGRNPTNVTYVKDRYVAGGVAPLVDQALDNTLIVTARGDAAVQWVRLAGDTGSVVRELRDSRLVDPIASEDNNTHGTESYLVSVADYGAGRLFNFRYGPIVFHTNGGARYDMGATGTDEFEFGGEYDPHGAPYSITVTNVT